MRYTGVALVLCVSLGAACSAQTTVPASPSAPATASPRPASPLDQTSSGPGPDGAPAAVISHGCVVSRYFGFSYRLPPNMTRDDFSTLPQGGADVNPGDFVLFLEDRRYQIPNFYHDEAVEAAAAYRGKGRDATAANFLRQLRNASVTRNDMLFGAIGPVTFGHQLFIKMPLQQTLPGGRSVYETVYAAEIRGYVVYFIFKSRDPDVLATLERSMQTFASSGQCEPAR